MTVKRVDTPALPVTGALSDLAPRSLAASEPKRASVWSLIASDVNAWHRNWYAADETVPPLRFREGVSHVWNFCGLRATLLYRVCFALKRSRVPLLPGMLTRLNITLHGFDVPPTIEIGPGLYVPHPTGTVVTAKRIGANVTLISGITIGTRGPRSGFPIIEDGVFVGAGARVLGGITIGEGASIGANAVVLKDIPAGATAVGVPAVIKYPRPANAGQESANE